jgi:hypothetical protein
MPRRKKQAQPETEAPEVEERVEVSNSAARATTIREVCQEIGELDRQIDGLKAERKMIVDTRIVADLGMKKAHFATAYKLYQLDHDERDVLQDTIRECFAALGVGEQLNWLDAVQEAASSMNAEARKAGYDDGLSGHRRRASEWPSGEYGHADYELGHAEGDAAFERAKRVGDVPAAAEG